MAGQELAVARWSVRGQALLEQGRKALTGSEHEKLRTLATRVPDSMQNGTDGPIRLAFVGQYSAGKSSLVKALTGGELDVPIGTKIVTQSVRGYDWCGLVLSDTPGIHTGVRPEHDQTSYEALMASDLLVFVITNELMDDYIGAHFRELAIERGKASEMLLVVNKMERAQGSGDEIKKIIREDLHRVCAPRTPGEDFPLVFTDAALALEIINEGGVSDEESAEDWRASGMDELVSAINKLSQERGVGGRLTNALYELEQILINALAELSTANPLLDGIEELLIRKRQILVDGRRDMSQRAKANIASAKADIGKLGHETANIFQGNASEADIQNAQNEALEKLEGISEKLHNKIESDFDEVFDLIEQQLQTLEEGDLARMLMPMLHKALDETSVHLNLTEQQVAHVNKVLGGVGRVGEWLAKNAVDPNKGTFWGLFKLRPYANTPVHKIVKALGKKLGYKFRPWEALKWTRHLAKVGRALTVITALGSLILEAHEDHNQKQRAEEMRRARQEVQEQFGQASRDIEMHYNELSKSFVASTIEPELEAIDQKLDDLRQGRIKEQRLGDTLQDLLDETRYLIKEIQKSQVLWQH